MINKLNPTVSASGDANILNEKELLKRIPISRRTAFNWIEAGKLPCIKIGRRKLFHWSSVEAALLRQQSGMEVA
jgi:predicted site-specific integrase-resolvase